ncbi:unnamed protein product [Prunus armeniaca]|uniref:Uncharacterized protein n=1 Tax=Prunus armeniaca TaxID=36596 RepID=A0A6J5UB27_PRUAR|nr:unnamed protein product [Prunus armeniaca]
MFPREVILGSVRVPIYCSFGKSSLALLKFPFEFPREVILSSVTFQIPSGSHPRLSYISNSFGKSSSALLKFPFSSC